MAFDPYTNEEIMELFSQKSKTNELTKNVLKNYYKIPIMCLLRI